MGSQQDHPAVVTTFLLVLAVVGVFTGIATAGGGTGPPGAGGEDVATPDAHATAFEEDWPSADEEATCERCHATMETNRTPRDLENEVKYQPNHEFDLEHADGQWCLDCHAADNMNELRLPNGSTVAWTTENETKQCASCHGPVYEDWTNQVHGKWTGSYEEPVPDKYCTDCHDPHDPEFHAIEPDPAPEEPPAGPAVAQAVLPGGYYAAVGLAGTLIAGLLGYAALDLRRRP
ncbi:hypothetical protein HSRCO_2830 [Halanaeroarchaeum sp. HSR-CO]|uniref:cytochrome c3 family protein n=1 Tax=Halanaeroarchaeum sp. HSR-CO TaxID=2866382 RepID=UPI00217EFEE7|nr:cytochrome c3 family protein [Halanaeroarchaeum sp. HSR-CO]UWG49086.1 hypothetical protein HSRCO_2830 [Halanaeroarchaeum sp. HSR-CO]